ncbi:MAG: universal stress protein [Verrucomicrobiales bacterium]|nr:universal stress protein [Verrucomicrobiales bacterium]
MDRSSLALVGVEFSECAKAALQQAARMARRQNATLHVLRYRMAKPEATPGFHKQYKHMLQRRSKDVVGASRWR